MSPKKEEISSYTNKKNQKFVYLEKFERTKEAIKTKFDNQDYNIELLEKKVSILVTVLSVLAAVVISFAVMWILISI
jgi:hypothetical protein